MSNIILSTALINFIDSSESSVDSSQVNITVFVEDRDWVGHFNRLQIFRSTSGPSGPFEELTGTDWAPPRLPKGAEDPPATPVTGRLINIVDVELELLINDSSLTVTFTGSDPLTFTQVATQITDQSSGRLTSYVDSAGGLVIEAVQPGLDSRLFILPSEGAVLLGLPIIEPDSVALGRDPRPALVIGQALYETRDHFGSRDYYYRTRFINTVTGAQSEPSVSSSPKNAVGVSVSNVIIGYLDVVFQSGKAWEGAEVHLYNDGVGPLIDGQLVTGQASVRYTDESGHVEFPVVRGQRLTLSVQGTNHIRTFTAPTDLSIKKFNFFDSTIADEDVFTVSVPDIVVAERRTL